MKHLINKKNRVLLKELVITDFKLRYQNSVLGYLWSLLRPLLLFVILYIVFIKFLGIGANVEHYAIYLLFGLMLWNFFVEMTTQSLGSIVSRGDLIRKISISRWLIVVSTSISALINLALNGVVLVVFMAINGVGPKDSLVFLPLTLIELYVFALGVSLFLAAAFVKYRDMTYIWDVILQGGFYATPIFYPLSVVPSETFQKIIMLNPIAQITQDAKYELVTHQTATIYQVFDGGPYVFIPFAIVAIVAIVGVLYFRKQSRYFAENV